MKVCTSSTVLILILTPTSCKSHQPDFGGMDSKNLLELIKKQEERTDKLEELMSKQDGEKNDLEVKLKQLTAKFGAEILETNVKITNLEETVVNYKTELMKADWRFTKLEETLVRHKAESLVADMKYTKLEETLEELKKKLITLREDSQKQINETENLETQLNDSSTQIGQDLIDLKNVTSEIQGGRVVP